MAPDPDVPEATPVELRVTLTWEQDGDALRGLVVAQNVSDHPVRISSKPDLTPLRHDGTSLDAHTVVTAEFRSPCYVVVEPGQRAAAPVTWAGWDGPLASAMMLVRLPGGEVTVEAAGPSQPPASGAATNLSSSWFSLLDES